MLGSSVIGMLKGVFGITRETVNTLLQPGTAGKAIIRAPGGTPGTNEVQVSYSGTSLVIANMTTATGSFNFMGSTFSVLDIVGGSRATFGTPIAGPSASCFFQSGEMRSGNSPWTICSGNAILTAADIGWTRVAAGVGRVTAGTSGNGWWQVTAGRPGSRAEALFGPGVVITASQVADAKRS